MASFHFSKLKSSFCSVILTSSTKFSFRYFSVRNRMESVVALSSFVKVDFPMVVALGRLRKDSNRCASRPPSPIDMNARQNFILVSKSTTDIWLVTLRISDFEETESHVQSQKLQCARKMDVTPTVGNEIVKVSTRLHFLHIKFSLITCATALFSMIDCCGEGTLFTPSPSVEETSSANSMVLDDRGLWCSGLVEVSISWWSLHFLEDLPVKFRLQKKAVIVGKLVLGSSVKTAQSQCGPTVCNNWWRQLRVVICMWIAPSLTTFIWNSARGTARRHHQQMNKERNETTKLNTDEYYSTQRIIFVSDDSQCNDFLELGRLPTNIAWLARYDWERALFPAIYCDTLIGALPFRFSVKTNNSKFHWY